MTRTPMPGSLLSVLLASLALAALAPAPALAQGDAGEAAAELARTVQRRVDLNLAGEQELLVLPQVGPVVARRIVEYRKAVGPFRKVEELLNVKGIGRKTLERLRPLVTLGAPGDADTASTARSGSGS